MTEEQKAKDATRYVVIKLDDMEIASGPFGSEGAARADAEAYARRSPGVDYGIFQKVLVARAELVVETKGVVG
jgi:hypothetical protein